MGLETMTINGGMQDAVAGGKIALHSAFLNDLMEMPELSGDSIARTVDMALARIVVQNCNLNWFNLAEPCSTVTELIKCNHLCMRYNSLEPADVFSVLFKAATQVLDMPQCHLHDVGMIIALPRPLCLPRPLSLLVASTCSCVFVVCSCTGNATVQCS